MDDKIFAKQLRKPAEAVGKYVGNVMNDINSFMNTYTYKKININ